MTKGGKNAAGRCMGAIIGTAKKAGDYLVKLKSSKVKKAASTMLVCTIILLGWIISLHYFMADKYGALVRIGESAAAGEAADSGVIDYGTLAKGGSAARFITVENKGNHKLHIKVIIIGNISDILKADKDDFTLFPQDRENIEMMADIPKSADKAQYEGRVIIFKFPEIF